MEQILEFGAEQFSIYQIAQRLDEKWTNGGTKGGMIMNIANEILSPTDNEYQEILSNIIDKFPFKSIVANQKVNGNYLVDSEVLFVAIDSMNRILRGESLDLIGGRKIHRKNYPIGYFEDFKFNFIIVKPSQVGKFDYTRINKY